MRNIIVILAMATALRAAAAQYSVSAVAMPTGWFGTATALNNLGQVVAYGYSNGTNGAPATNGLQVFIATTSTATLIPQPSGLILYTFQNPGISDSGLVMFDGLIGSTLQAFIANVSGFSLLPIPTPYPLAGPNNSGQVAGLCPLATSASLVCIGSTSGIAPIPLPSGIHLDAIYCCYINNAGQVAALTDNQIFVGTPAGSSTMPLPSGWALTSLNGLNDLGYVTGAGTNTAGVVQAFFSTNSGSTAIPLPPGATSVYGNPTGTPLSAISNSDIVIGNSNAGVWVWDNIHQTRLLNNLVPTGWNVYTVISVNNPGQVLAQAISPQGASEYVLLTPLATPATTPAPATFGLTIAGIALVALLAYKRSSTSAASGA